MISSLSPKRVLLTGAAGNIGYALVPLIANGLMLGSDQPVILHLLESPMCAERLRALEMEVRDSAYPLVKGIIATADIQEGFQDIDIAILVASVPRTGNMERKDLISKNSHIFTQQGRALDQYSKKTVKVLVVGNPANTNCLIAQRYAPSIPKENFSAMTRLDHNRCLGQLAIRSGVDVFAIRNVIIWGNHSSTQYPDANHALIMDKKASEVIQDDQWFNHDLIEIIQKRGMEVIKARGLSSACSAAHAACNHIHDWILGTPQGTWVSMAVSSDGSYGIPEGIIFSYPVTCQDGQYKIVQGLQLTERSLNFINITQKELYQEREDAFAIIDQS